MMWNISWLISQMFCFLNLQISCFFLTCHRSKSTSITININYGFSFLFKCPGDVTVWRCSFMQNTRTLKLNGIWPSFTSTFTSVLSNTATCHNPFCENGIQLFNETIWGLLVMWRGSLTCTLALRGSQVFIPPSMSYGLTAAVAT